MAWSINYNSGLKIIEVRSSGTWDTEQDERLLEELKIQSEVHQCQLFLLDHSATKFNFKLLNIFDRPALYERFNISKKARAALVMSSLGQDTIFFENVCVNRGFNVRVFDNREKAVQWLVEGT